MRLQHCSKVLLRELPSLSAYYSCSYAYEKAVSRGSAGFSRAGRGCRDMSGDG